LYDAGYLLSRHHIKTEKNRECDRRAKKIPGWDCQKEIENPLTTKVAKVIHKGRKEVTSNDLAFAYFA
jgi:hypothetical protein